MFQYDKYHLKLGYPEVVSELLSNFCLYSQHQTLILVADTQSQPQRFL